MVSSTRASPFLRRVLRFSLLGACFVSLASIGAAAVLGFSGLFPLPSIGKMMRLLPVIFAASFVLVMIGITFWEQFLGLDGLR